MYQWFLVLLRPTNLYKKYLKKDTLKYLAIYKDKKKQQKTKKPKRNTTEFQHQFIQQVLTCRKLKSTNQPTNQPTNKPAIQPANQPTLVPYFLSAF